MDKFATQAQKFVDFVNSSPSPYHAVDSAGKLLQAHGYEHLSERDTWTIKPGGKYFYTRNQSTLCAFAVGHKYQPGNPFAIVAAHTDSPTLKIRPVSAVESVGYQQVGCEMYGGGLWYTWFDRDLSVAGRVIVKKADKYESTLVRIDEPILRVPTLAVHLDRTVNTDGFKYNLQNHLVPVLTTSVSVELNQKAEAGESSQKSAGDKPKHHPLLMKMLAEKLACDPEDIQNFDLNLYDTQPAVVGGPLREFVFSPRCDNLGMSFCSLHGLIDSTSAADSLANESQIRAIMLFDNEEVGSSSAHGAGSPMLAEMISRIVGTMSKEKDAAMIVSQTILRSFLVSADMAHAVHPNYSGNHEPLHRPALNKGTVIKYNANLRYATTGPTAFILLELAKRNNIPIQEFLVKNDSPCGSTIGPILSALAGIRTVDIGNPQLSMHSIRETAGAADFTYGTQLCRTFFEQFGDLDSSLRVD